MSERTTKNEGSGFRPLRGTIAGFLIDLARFGGRRLYHDNAPEMAAALAYRTIFSLVPVLVLSLVIFKAFLGEQGMRSALAQLMEYTGIDKIQFASDAPAQVPADVDDSSAPEPGTPANANDEPGSGAGPDSTPTSLAGTTRLSDTLQEFIDQTVSRIQGINFGIITVVGVLVLVYGALSLVIQVEQAFNQICRAPSGRSMGARLTTYFTLLVGGPLLLIGSFVLSRTALSYLSEISPWLGRPLSVASTLGITWLVLLGAYWRLPTSKIRLNAAAVGAFLAALLWEGAKAALAWFVAYLVSPETGGQIAVYGSLALLPIFLLWVYITWLIVLFGFEVTYAVQTVASGRHRFLDRDGQTPLIDPAVGVLVMRVLAERFREGKSCTVEELALRSGVSEAVVERILAHLIGSSFVHKVEQREDVDEPAYAPARAPESLSAAEVLKVMHQLAGEPPADGKAGLADLSVLRLLRESQIQALRTLNITGLGRQERDPGPTND